MLTSSSTAQGLFDNQENLVRSGHGLVLSQEAISNATQTMTVKMKLAELGMKALSVAGNMLLFMGISMAISGVIKGIDYLIHREEKLQEALDESISALESTTSEIESLEEQVKTCAERIAELQKLKDAGTISIADEEELNNLKEENKELERQIALLQDKQIREGKQVLRDAKKQDDEYVQSRYALGNRVTPAQELHGAVQSFIYAQNTDNDALADEHGERVEDMYEKIQPTLEAYRALEEAGYDLSDAEEEHYSQLKKAEDEYLLYTHLLNGTKESFVALSEEMQKQVLIRDLFYKKGMTQEQATDVVENIKPEDYVKMWESDFEFTPPDPNDYDSAEEYGKAYADAWIKGAQEGVEENGDKMTVSLSELEGASDKIKTLGSAFKELSDDGYITTKTLGEIQTATGLSGDEWEIYKTKLLNAKSGSSEFNQIMSEMTYKILDNAFASKDLTSITEDEVEAILRENGVVNASAVAHDWLSRVKNKEKATNFELGKTVDETKSKLIEEAKSCGITTAAYAQLVAQEIVFNQNDLDISGKIQKLATLQQALGNTASTAILLNNALSSTNTSGRPERDFYLAVEKYGIKKTANGLYEYNGVVYKAGMDAVNAAMAAEFTKGVNVEIPKVDYSGAVKDSGSDKNKPDYEDPTDAIINRINLRSKELEQQEESIQNAIEIAELEKDYKKQISLTNDLIAKRKDRLTELETANAGLHNEAEWLRNSTPQWNEEEWFDSQGNATEAYNVLYNSSSKEEQEKIKDQFEKISKIKKAWIKNSEEIASLTTQVYKDEMETIPNLWEEFVDDKISDIERNIELRNNIGGGNYSATISDYEKIQELAHQRANDWRSAGFDEDFEEIQKWQKVWWDFENRKRDTYREQHENAIRDIEHARDMALEANPSVNTISYYKQMQEEYHKEAERLRALDPEKYKEEIQELQKKWWDAENTIVDNERQKFINAMEKILSAKEKEYEREKEILSLKLDKNNSRQSVLKSYYNVINAIKQAHHEINKELSASKSMYEYLDEESKKLLFNQSDYNALSKKLNSIQGEALELQQRYKVALKNASEETLPKITSEYQMQYETLMKSYEIAKADLEIAKKKQKLNNVLNERNVKMFINGRWTQVANIQDVIDAQSELAEAEYAKQQADTSLKQSKELNELQTKQDELSMQMKFIDKDISDWRKRWNELQEQIKNEQTDIYQSLDNLATSGIPALEKIIVSLGEPLADLYKDITGESLDVPIYKGLPVVGDYKYEKITPHAEGTRKTRLETAIMGEKGFEAYIKSSGELYPLSQPTIGKVNPGGIVFNREQLEGVRALWDMSHYGKATIENINKTVSSNSNHHIVDNSITINGVSISEQGNEDLLNGLRRFASTYKYS